jgi:hypothetical protein
MYGKVQTRGPPKKFLSNLLLLILKVSTLEVFTPKVLTSQVPTIQIFNRGKLSAVKIPRLKIPRRTYCFGIFGVLFILRILFSLHIFLPVFF